MPRLSNLDRDHDASHLVELYAERTRLTRVVANADQPTSKHASAVLAADAELNEACERFRRRHYPRRAEVIVGLYAVMVCSATRRRVETVYDGWQRAAIPMGTR